MDHDILLQRLKVIFGINGVALIIPGLRVQHVGLSLYDVHMARCQVNNRRSYVCSGTGVSLGPHHTAVHYVHCTADLISVIESYGLSPHK